MGIPSFLASIWVPRLERLPAGQVGTVLLTSLRNLKRDMYDSAEISLSNQFLKNVCTGLSAIPDLRAYPTPPWTSASMCHPIVFSETAGRLPWDTPNRLLSWGLFPVTRKNTLGYFLEWHATFPFSPVHDDEGRSHWQTEQLDVPALFQA